MKFSTESVASIFRKVNEATSILIEQGKDGDFLILRPDFTNSGAMFLRWSVGDHQEDENFHPASSIEGIKEHLNKMAQECAAVAETIENMTRECSVITRNELPTTATNSNPKTPDKPTEASAEDEIKEAESGDE